MYWISTLLLVLLNYWTWEIKEKKNAHSKSDSYMAYWFCMKILSLTFSGCGHLQSTLLPTSHTHYSISVVSRNNIGTNFPEVNYISYIILNIYIPTVEIETHSVNLSISGKWKSHTKRNQVSIMYVRFIWILGGGVHSGATRHCGQFWPIVPAPAFVVNRLRYFPANTYVTRDPNVLTTARMSYLGLCMWWHHASLSDPDVSVSSTGDISS
jgi:hypothetical protein